MARYKPDTIKNSLRTLIHVILTITVKQVLFLDQFYIWSKWGTGYCNLANIALLASGRVLKKISQTLILLTAPAFP